MFFKSPKFFLITIIILINICIYSNENKLKEEIINLTFYTLEKYYLILENNETSNFFKKIENDLTIYFLHKSYTFSIFMNNILFIDYYNAYYDYNNINNPSLLLLSSFYNTASLGIENKLSFKNKFDFETNLELYANVPFYGTFSLVPTPVMKAYGSYYFGFEWEFKEYLYLELIPEYDYITFYPSTYLKLIYEFFRFYGPEKFRFSIMIENTLDIKIPSKYYLNTLNNYLKAGVYVSFLGLKIGYLKIGLYFIQNIFNEFTPFNHYSDLIGFSSEIEYIIKYFEFVFKYEGSIDILSINKNWISYFEASIKFSFYK